MKLKRSSHFVIFLVFLIVGIALNRCGQEAQIISLDLDVKELICEDGQKLFEGRILELQGITAVAVNIDARKALIKFRDTQANEKQIVDHLLGFGFTVNDVEGDVAAHRRLPSCCLEEKTAL